MHIFGITLILYILKISAPKGNTLISEMIRGKRDGRNARYEPLIHIGFRHHRPRVLTRTGFIFVRAP